MLLFTKTEVIPVCVGAYQVETIPGREVSADSKCYKGGEISGEIISASGFESPLCSFREVLIASLCQQLPGFICEYKPILD